MSLLTKKELLYQEKMIARLQAAKNAAKTKKLGVTASGYGTSQWNGMLNEDKLIKCDHFKKSGEKAKLDYLREELRKKRANKPIEVRRIDRT